jgi:hypothetical protein
MSLKATIKVEQGHVYSRQRMNMASSNTIKPHNPYYFRHMLNVHKKKKDISVNRGQHGLVIELFCSSVSMLNSFKGNMW